LCNSFKLKIAFRRLDFMGLNQKFIRHRKPQRTRGFFKLRTFAYSVKPISSPASSKKFRGKTVIAAAILLIAVLLVPFLASQIWLNQPVAPNNTPTPAPTPQTTPSVTPTPSQSGSNKDQTNNQQSTAQPTTNPTPITHKGPIESAQTMTSQVWKAVGANAWNYFNPGVGVDSKTGLPCSGNAYPYFTDWDLGVYIQAIIDASKLGLIKNDGAWGFDDRIGKVLTFLETRELNNVSYPYWFYQAADGGVFHNNSDVADFIVDVADTGRLLVALSNLKDYRANLTSRVTDFVYNNYGNRSDYAAIVPGLQYESQDSTNIYTYYVVYGFACFWPELAAAPERILDNINASGTVNVSGVILPKARLTSDVLLCLMFETNSSAKLTTLAHQVYLAHQAYNQATGKLRAFGEGASNSAWLWEWVVYSDGRNWTVMDGSGSEFTSSPVIYMGVSIGFLSLYNTAYAKTISDYLEHAFYGFSMGYGEGVTEAGFTLNSYTLHNNGLVLGAAAYAA
jgi:hypothetical protein